MSVDPAEALPSRPSPGAAGARLGELYAAHARMVYGICRMLLRDANEAEDATQEVFLSAYRNLLTGTDVRDPAAWLGTIARNACRRRGAARMRERLAADDEPTLVSPAAEEDAIDREETAALYAQLAALPDKQREAIVLRDLYGLRYDEVAKALGTSRPAVEALLFRGRRQLQRRLRPGVAAGVLVVPLAVQESIAYAVPGFASAAAPAGAAAAAAGIPLVAKLAAAGGAVAIAGSAGVVAQRKLPDPPARPPETRTQRAAPPAAEVVAARSLPALLPVPAGGFPAVARPGEDRSGPAGVGKPEDAAAGDDEHGDEAERPDDGADGHEDAAPVDRVEPHAEAEADADDDGDGHDAGDAQPEVADDHAAAPEEDPQPEQIAAAPETVGRDGEAAGDGGESGEGDRG